MKKRITSLALMAVLAFSISSCYTMTHTVGNGAQGGNETEKKQWYALFGLIPINQVDSKQMAQGKTDYVIETKHSFIDVIIGAFTGIVTVYPKTVKVKH